MDEQASPPVCAHPGCNSVASSSKFCNAHFDAALEDSRDETEEPHKTSLDDDERQPVISIHGIRTKGKWMSDLAPDLKEHGFAPVEFDYGFFLAVQLLWAGSRRKKVEWFLEEYTKTYKKYGKVPSIVAHSFGSYIVARSLEKYDQIKFDRIILCGSIVRDDYPWTHVAMARKQASKVLNDYGRHDFWAGIVGWVVRDAGPSGRIGFSDRAGDLVFQRENAQHRHSDYFNSLNFENNWIPFLKHESPQPSIPVPEGRSNWRFRTFCVLLVVVILSFMLRDHIRVGSFRLKHGKNFTVEKIGEGHRLTGQGSVDVSPAFADANASFVILEVIIQDNELLTSLSPVSDFEKIEKLKVSHCGLKQIGLNSDSVPELTHIEINDAPGLTEEAIKSLKGLPSVERVIVTPEARERFVRRHGKNFNVEVTVGGHSLSVHDSVDLSQAFADAKAAFVVLEATIQNNAELTSLSAINGFESIQKLRVSGCSLKQIGLNADIVADLTRIEISDAPGLSDDSMNSLSLLPALERIILHRCGQDFEGSESTWHSLEKLADNTSIRYLQLTHVPLRSLDGIQRLRALRSLTLDSCKDIESISAVGNCRTVNDVNLYTCPALNLEDLKKLENDNKWEALHSLRWSGLSDTASEILSRMSEKENLENRSRNNEDWFVPP